MKRLSILIGGIKYENYRRLHALSWYTKPTTVLQANAPAIKNHSFCFTEDLVLHITTLKYLTGLLMKVVQLFPTTSSAAVILM
ncbi:hypothetical protein COPCOM_03785 [Coprococcus comes ATCC 27758]|uniref:Uncharacterized protein n=1 Tax=Coprococcus comes ATCC 27758 TaxID=470146 RepID=C0BF22_9FIRM|nr:hypothetical protein COPCOM_03785 [Coprococcus comes ATCC 27758]